MLSQDYYFLFIYIQQVEVTAGNRKFTDLLNAPISKPFVCISYAGKIKCSIIQPSLAW